MTRHTNTGEHSWDNGRPIEQAQKRSHKAHSLPANAGGVTWPAHVVVQRIPGMERTQGVPGNVYVDPASVPKQSDHQAWSKP